MLLGRGLFLRLFTSDRTVTRRVFGNGRVVGSMERPRWMGTEDPMKIGGFPKSWMVYNRKASKNMDDELGVAPKCRETS